MEVNNFHQKNKKNDCILIQQKKVDAYLSLHNSHFIQNVLA